jgi:hypothetical protein
MDSFTKEPGEDLRRGYNFVPDMAAGDTVSSYSVAVQDRDGTDVTSSTVVSSSEQESSGVVTAMFTGGDHGQSYLVIFEAVTTGGETIIGKVIMAVWSE